jgi:F0F1-type ATP synthase epsilon subunit
MSHIKPWNRVACAVTLAAFSTSALLPHSARADGLQQDSYRSVVKDVSAGIRLARQSGEARDVIEFLEEDLNEADVRNIISLLSTVSVKSLPDITVQGSSIRFGKPADGIPELKVIDAEAGRFRFGKKELLVREGMSFEEFYSQFQARLDSDSSTITSFLWSLLVEKVQASEDVVVVPDAEAPADHAAPVDAKKKDEDPTKKKGLSTGAKVAIAVGVVLVVALIAYLIYKSSKDKKEKKEKEAEAKKKKEEKELKKSQEDAAYTSAKTQYDAVRGEYETRCGHYPDGYQMWAITSEGASKSEKTSAMTSKGAELADAPCETSSSESEATAH